MFEIYIFAKKIIKIQAIRKIQTQIMTSYKKEFKKETDTLPEGKPESASSYLSPEKKESADFDNPVRPLPVSARPLSQAL